MENNAINEKRMFRKDGSQAAEMLTIVLNNIKQGIVVIGQDYAVLAFNKQMETLFGLQQGTIEVGRDFREVLKVWADATGQTRDYLTRTLRELDLPNPFEIEFPQMIQGAQQWCLLTHNPLPSKGFVRTYSDITGPVKSFV